MTLLVPQIQWTGVKSNDEKSGSGDDRRAKCPRRTEARLDFAPRRSVSSVLHLL